QAVPAGPFRWLEKPATAIREWTTSPERDLLDSVCTYAGFTHRRRVLFLKPRTLIILDSVAGGGGEHLLDQFWHLAALEDGARLSFNAPAEVQEGWRSRVFGAREPSPVMWVCHRGPLPAEMAAVLDLSPECLPSSVLVRKETGGTVVEWRGGQVEFP